RDFRRDMDREVRREGHVLFSPVNLDSSSGSTGGSDSSSEGDVLGVVLFERQVEGGYAAVVASGNDDEHNSGEETGTNIGFYRLAFRLTNTGGVPVNLTISTVIADAPDEADTDYNFALVQINADPDEEAKPSTLAPLAVELDPSEVYEF